MSILGNLFPPEVSALIGVVSEWFANSGLRESLDENGTTGIQHFITKINGRPAVISAAVSYLAEEDTAQIDTILLTKTAETENNTEPEA